MRLAKGGSHTVPYLRGVHVSIYVVVGEDGLTETLHFARYLNFLRLIHVCFMKEQGVAGFPALETK